MRQGLMVSFAEMVINNPGSKDGLYLPNNYKLPKDQGVVDTSQCLFSLLPLFLFSCIGMSQLSIFW
jgi:hypothetical protein